MTVESHQDPQDDTIIPTIPESLSSAERTHLYDNAAYIIQASRIQNSLSSYLVQGEPGAFASLLNEIRASGRNIHLDEDIAVSGVTIDTLIEDGALGTSESPNSFLHRSRYALSKIGSDALDNVANVSSNAQGKVILTGVINSFQIKLFDLQRIIYPRLERFKRLPMPVISSENFQRLEACEDEFFENQKSLFLAQAEEASLKLPELTEKRVKLIDEPDSAQTRELNRQIKIYKSVLIKQKFYKIDEHNDTTHELGKQIKNQPVSYMPNLFIYGGDQGALILDILNNANENPNIKRSILECARDIIDFDNIADHLNFGSNKELVGVEELRRIATEMINLSVQSSLDEILYANTDDEAEVDIFAENHNAPNLITRIYNYRLNDDKNLNLILPVIASAFDTVFHNIALHQYRYPGKSHRDISRNILQLFTSTIRIDTAYDDIANKF